PLSRIFFWTSMAAPMLMCPCRIPSDLYLCDQGSISAQTSQDIVRNRSAGPAHPGNPGYPNGPESPYSQAWGNPGRVRPESRQAKKASGRYGTRFASEWYADY